MNIPKLTLDTNLLIEYWRQQKRMSITEKLLSLAKLGKIDLAVTARIREDIPRPPLADRIDELPELQTIETSSVIRLDYDTLGSNMLGDKKFGDFYATACELANRRKKTPPDWRDWDHLHAHYLLKRDVFLTWDQGIICLSQELKDNFSINVIRPDQYVQDSGL